MPTYWVKNVGKPDETHTTANAAADALRDGGCIFRKWRKHWYLQLDRSWDGGGYTSVRVGYGGLIQEPLADAKERFLRNEPHFANEHRDATP